METLRNHQKKSTAGEETGQAGWAHIGTEKIPYRIFPLASTPYHILSISFVRVASLCTGRLRPEEIRSRCPFAGSPSPVNDETRQEAQPISLCPLR